MFLDLKMLYNLKKKNNTDIMHKYPQLYKSVVCKHTKHTKINKHFIQNMHTKLRSHTRNANKKIYTKHMHNGMHTWGGGGGGRLI